MLNILSLGAGVQSTTMALMAAHGEITPMPDAAIFADTGAEPAAVYEHLKWLSSGNVLPFPVHTVNGGNLFDDLMAGRISTGQRFASIPFFGLTDVGHQMMARRQCTKEYKIVPIRRKVAELLGGKKKPGSVSMWIGISTDEAARAKPSVVQYIVNRHPLLDLRMRRWDCLQWLQRHGYPEPPKSACTFCPYRKNDQWRDLKLNDPAGWQQALEVDRAIREFDSTDGKFTATLFLHRDLKPLAEVDIRSDEDRGQGDLFNQECEGICGV